MSDWDSQYYWEDIQSEIIIREKKKRHQTHTHTCIEALDDCEWSQTNADDNDIHLRFLVVCFNGTLSI